MHESQAKASEEAETTKERLQEVEQSLQQQQQMAGDTAMTEQLRADVEQLETHCHGACLISGMGRDDSGKCAYLISVLSCPVPSQKLGMPIVTGSKPR